MKKLLLLLLTLLAFAPPGAKAQLTEVVLIDNTNMPENAEYNLFSNETTWYKVRDIESTVAMTEIKSIRIPVPDYDDYIIMEFDKSGYSGSTYTTRFNSSVLWITHGMKFNFHMQSDVGTISSIKINSHVWVGNVSDYPKYCLNSFNRLKHNGCSTSTCNSTTYVHNINVSNPSRIVDGFYVEKLSNEATSVTAAIDRITLIVTPKPFAIPSTPIVSCTNVSIKDATIKFIDEKDLTLNFQKGDTSDPDDIKIFGKFVPDGTDEASISYTEYSLSSNVTIPAQNGDFYYYATNPLSSNAKSEIAAIRIKSALVTSKIFDYDAQVDGKLRVFVKGNMQGEEYQIGKTYNGIQKLVYIPSSESGEKDAVIITFNGTANINSRWLSLSPETRFTITTQYGGTLYKETFDCTASAYDDWSGARCDYINYDDSFRNTMSYWEGGKKQNKKNTYINNPATIHTFYASTNTGLDELTLTWIPGAEKPISLPYFTHEDGAAGSYSAGVFRLFDKVDMTINVPMGEAKIFMTSDPTVNEIPSYATTIVQDGYKYTVNSSQMGGDEVRVLIQAQSYTDPSHKSYISQAFVQRLDVRSFDKLSDIITEDNTGNEFAVTNGCELTITGKYRTRVDNGADLNTYYAYLRDSEGRNIKLVSQGQDFPESYKAGSKLSAGAFVGDFRYNYGSPEIVINSSNYSFLKPASVIADYEEVLDEVTALTTTDFNRKVRLRNVRWLAANNEVEDKDGAKYLIYSRLVACDDPSEFTSPMFNSEAGTHWCIEGYVGQVNGKTAIFPTAKVLPCPTKPVLLAPNPVEGDIEAISKTVTVTVAPEEGMSYFYCINEEPTDMEALTAVPEEGIELGDEHFRDVCELYVYAKSADGLWSTEPAILRITRHSAIEVASIADFKKVFIDETTGAEKKDLFEDGSLKADAIDETAGIATHYQLTGDAIVVKRTPNYLYLRDYKGGVSAGQGGLNSMNYLLVYNANHWEQPKVKDEAAEGGERELRAGDVISGIALVPELTSLGNLRSNTTSFARTVAVNYDITSDSTKVQPLTVAVGYDDASSDHYFSNVTVDDNYRMRYYTFEGVKVKYDDATDTYTLDIATPVRMSFDIFSTRGGWVPAYAEGASYNITGIVLRDGEEGHFAIAPISFKGSGTVAAPSVFLTENENNDALASSDIQEGGHTLKVKMTAEPGAVIYYSVNGKNPLDNADADTRKVYTAGEEITLEFAEGQDRAVVMAFAAEPGKTPSAVVTRTFIKSSRELTYLLNFINQGEQDRLYHFNGHVAVAALGGKWMMVRGAVGHYLPIYNADAQWDADAYKTGGYLTDFVMRYDELEGNIRGIAEAGRLFPEATSEKDPSWEEITFIPDSVTSISERNARRYVKLHSANVQAAAAAAAEGDSDAAKWTVTGTSHQGAPHALVLDILGTTAGASTLEDGGMYDITGFVMLDANGAAQLWATEVEKIAQTARVSVKINGNELTPVKDADTREYEAEFVRGALVTLEVSDPRPSTVIRYSYDNMNWFTYGEPFLVTESVEQIHAVAQALNERESVHTHIKLTRKDETAAPVISAAEGAESSTVTISAEEGSIIHWWTSEDATVKTYTAPFAVKSTMLVYATAQVEGKTESSVAYKLVKVAGAESPAPADKISGRVKFDIDDSQPGKVIVYIAPEEEIAGEYEIYYTTTPGITLTPATGILYNKETGVEITESKSFSAILVEKGKEQGELCDFNVWVHPAVTGIDGIEGEGENAVRVDGDSIVAPQGSEVYDLNGRRVNPTGLASGVYIVRTPDGKAIKVRI